MNFKKSISVISLCIALAGALFIFFTHEASDYYRSACERMKNIASDVDKVTYLEKWAHSKISDKQFLRLLGKRSKVFLDGGRSDLRSEIDIDLQFLGLNQEAAYVSFNRSYEDRENPIDQTRINSFEVGTGRFGVIISLNDPNELGLEWPPEDLKRLKRVNSNVWVICR